MTTSPSEAPTSTAPATRTPYARAAIWVAIAGLIASAIVTVVWVLIGSADGTIGRAFFTIILLAGFAGIAIAESRIADRREAWFALASIGSWIAALLIGILLIWMPEPERYFGYYSFLPFERVFRFALIVAVLQAALYFVRLYVGLAKRARTLFARIVAPITIGLVGVLALLLILPLVFNEWIEYRDFYWRVVVAITILAAVGAALIPLVSALLAPPRPSAPRVRTVTRTVVRPVAPARPATPAVPVASAPPAPSAPAAAAVTAAASEPAAVVTEPSGAATTPASTETAELLPWPMYVDGVTPLPMLPDGSPDWNAYYTGHPTPGARVFPPVTAAASEPPADS